MIEAIGKIVLWLIFFGLLTVPQWIRVYRNARENNSHYYEEKGV